ncbi:12314_t:CDS:2, partial [Cetraspora pellucida]
MPISTPIPFIQNYKVQTLVQMPKLKYNIQAVEIPLHIKQNADDNQHTF